MKNTLHAPDGDTPAGARKWAANRPAVIADALFSPGGRLSWLLLALLLSLVPARAQMEGSEPGRRIGLHLACQCGSCSHTVARCEMFGCFAQTTREEIARMSASGMSDQAILDHYIAKHGQQIYRAQPSAFGWLVPYLALLPGAALIYWFIRRYRRPALVLATGGRPGGPAAPAIDPRYLAQIEKDLE